MSGLSLFADPAWVWIIAGTALMLLEVFATGAFLFWIGLGAIATGLSLMLAPMLPLWAQLLLFGVATLLSVVIGLKVVRRQSLSAPATELNSGLSTLIGSPATVTEVFVGGDMRIRIHDTSYNARCNDSLSTLHPGDRVTVRSIGAGGVLEVTATDGGTST